MTAYVFTYSNLNHCFQVVILTAVAMVRVGSHEALSGMYAWCAEHAGRRLPWLRDLVKLVQRRTEVIKKQLIN